MPKVTHIYRSKGTLSILTLRAGHVMAVIQITSREKAAQVRPQTMGKPHGKPNSNLVSRFPRTTIFLWRKDPGFVTSLTALFHRFIILKLGKLESWLLSFRQDVFESWSPYIMLRQLWDSGPTGKKPSNANDRSQCSNDEDGTAETPEVYPEPQAISARELERSFREL